MVSDKGVLPPRLFLGLLSPNKWTRIMCHCQCHCHHLVATKTYDGHCMLMKPSQQNMKMNMKKWRWNSQLTKVICKLLDLGLRNSFLFTHVCLCHSEKLTTTGTNTLCLTTQICVLTACRRLAWPKMTPWLQAWGGTQKWLGWLQGMLGTGVVTGARVVVGAGTWTRQHTSVWMLQSCRRDQ